MPTESDAGAFLGSPTSAWGFPAFGPGAGDGIYLRPVGRLTGPPAAAALGARQAIGTGRAGEAALAVEVALRHVGGGASRSTVPAADSLDRLGRDAESPAIRRLRLLAQRLQVPRMEWAGLALDRVRVMGILNVTPDSFSDGGDFADAAAAIAQGRAMLGAGADVIDVGGESTRPGAAPVAPEVEAARVVPVVRALAEAGALVSIDTRRPSVMAAAVEAGARIVNDVTALSSDGAIPLAARRGVAVVLMHMQGEPRSMQADPRYDVAALDVLDFLEGRIAACAASGIPRSAILVDPGIGFGKTVDHNLEILDALGLYRTTGCAVALGVSRKGFIGALSGERRAKDRLGGSLAAALLGAAAGADLVRVHDVAETVQALAVARAIESGAG